jgi:hypothetical protein
VRASTRACRPRGVHARARGPWQRATELAVRGRGGVVRLLAPGRYQRDLSLQVVNWYGELVWKPYEFTEIISSRS